MYIIEQTEDFEKWLETVKDPKALARIAFRIDQAEEGNFGDVEPVGNGVSEMRVDVGAGYRLYYARSGKLVYLLLIGGDKKTQKKDIKRAKDLWNEIKKERK